MQYSPDFTKEEKQLYDNLVPDEATGTVRPFFRIVRTFDLTDPSIADLGKFFTDAAAEGCDDVWFYEDYERGEHYVECYGQASLNIDELEVYNSLMEKVRAWEKEKLEYNIAEVERRLAELKDELENFVW